MYILNRNLAGGTWPATGGTQANHKQFGHAPAPSPAPAPGEAPARRAAVRGDGARGAGRAGGREGAAARAVPAPTSTSTLVGRREDRANAKARAST